jgi:hypothetical protein
MISLRFKLPGLRPRPCRTLLTFAMLMAKRGRSSVVEHQLPKLKTRFVLCSSQLLIVTLNYFDN